jgi:tRNA-dihydrouridine synthase B
MIGRAAHGRPWIFREIAAALAGNSVPAPPSQAELAAIMREHVDGLCTLYGETQGVRVARKHLGWYLAGRPGGEALRALINRVESAREQFVLIDEFFMTLVNEGEASLQEAA